MTSGAHGRDPNTVSLIGDIRAANATSHGDLLCDLLDLACAPTFVVDCSQIELLAPQGLTMMLWVHRHGVAQGTEVWWVGLSPRHVRLLEDAGLAPTLRCRPAGEPGSTRSIRSRRSARPEPG